ncbi:MAG: putative drug exporter of the superfamily [Solirubrobacteraceae bacterium]|nr:putative drug exporter of the superfamily [Solirubrobacteraceae bacterium]
MHRFMLGIDRFVRRHRTAVLAVWLVALAAAVPFAMRQSDHLTGGGYGVPGSESQRVESALGRDFAAGSRATLAAVVVPAPGASAADVRAALHRVGAAAGATAHVELPARARAVALAQLRRDGVRTLVVPLTVDVTESDAPDVATRLRDRLGVGAGATGPVELHLIGQSAMWAGLQDLTKRDLARAESAGFPIVAVILLAVFGSLAAAALPLSLGLVSVVVTGALIYALSMAMEMSVFVTNMASMIGIGVAVDYSLFVLARYRAEVRAGRTPDEARAVALSTSGVAVTFSGLTVIVSLAGLWMVDTTAIRSMALGAILVVAVSVLAAATLLPALISLLGRRAHAPGRLFAALHRVRRSWAPRRPGSTRPGAPPAPGFWTRWATAVMRRPGRSLVAGALVLAALATPALWLSTTDGALRQFPAGNETRRGFEAARAVTGPGAAAPVRVVAPRAQAGAVAATLRADPAVARVLPAVASRDGARVLVSAVPRQDGESPQAKALVARLRDRLPAGAQVGGTSAGLVDFHDLVDGSMWKIAVFVLGLSYVVLLLLLRSAVLPLKAVAMNLLSVGAAYGVLSLVFGEVDAITPPLVLAVVFGLSMDYEVFLLSNIRERWRATGDTRRAVGEGLAASAKTITSAALIMSAVFAVFVLTGVPSIQQIGLGCAVAIAVDATIVRLVLVPAAMELLGRWNWWLPAPLRRVLPSRGLEEALAA